MNEFVREKEKESKKVQRHTHKLAMHRRKGVEYGILDAGVFAGVLCEESNGTTEPAEDEGRLSGNGEEWASVGNRQFYRAPSNTPRTSSTVHKSARKGTKSVNSVSWGSLNHEETGTALFG